MRKTKFDKVQHIERPRYPWFGEEDQLEDGVLYVVDGEPADGMQVIEYNCPCGCGNTVMIPYYKDGQGKVETPGWAYQEADGRVTLSPSILSFGFPCRSHYFIRENRIDWCN